MISFMVLVYTGIALVLVFGVIAIFTSMTHKDRTHDWIPTKTAAIIGGIAVLLFILGGIWLALQSLLP